jgi:hypothetical protein
VRHAASACDVNTARIGTSIADEIRGAETSVRLRRVLETVNEWTFSMLTRRNFDRKKN